MLSQCPIQTMHNYLMKQMANSDSSSTDGEAIQHSADTKKLLEEWEEKFKDRYTEKDEDYKRHVDNAMPPPPCVENWYVRPKRTFDWSR